jgi:hypothetical protein
MKAIMSYARPITSTAKKAVINQNSTLRSLDGMRAFYLGQLEGNAMRSIGSRSAKSDNEVNDILAASTNFDFGRKIKDNYEFITENKNDPKAIADYLCAINWLAHFYDDFTEPRPAVKEILKNYFLTGTEAYFEECADFYSYAYSYLNERFYDDASISDNVKQEVYRLND